MADSGYWTQGKGAISDQTAGELKTDKERVEKFQKWFRDSMEDTEPLRERTIENRKMLSNDQWTEADKNQALIDRRPALNINKVTNIIMSLSGLQKKQRQDIKLLPFEPDDARGVELMDPLLKAIRERTRIEKEDTAVFIDKISSGLGFWKLFIDFSQRPQGDIRVARIDPLTIFYDPNYPDVAWDDLEYVIHAEWRTMDQMLAEYSEHEEVIRSKYGEWLLATPDRVGDSHNSRRAFWDAQTQRIRLLEVWYKELERVEVAAFADGYVETDPDQIRELKTLIANAPEDMRTSIAFVTRPVQFVRVAHLFDNEILDDDDTPLPFQKFPLRPSLGYYFWEHPFGMVDIMKDPQREKNKRRSAITELAGRTAHSGWLNQKGSGATQETLENYANGSGVVIDYESVAPIPIKPAEIPQVLVLLENKADAEIHEVVNYNDELMGEASQNTVSGRAIEARQRGGLISQEYMFDSFTEEQIDVATLMVEMIKKVITKEEAQRILGALAARNPRDEKLQGLAQSPPTEIQDILSKAFSTTYDVIVTTKPYDPSFKMAQFNSLLDFGKLAKEHGVQLPAEVLIKAARDAGVIDEVHAEEMIQKYMAIPPDGAQGGIPQQGGPESQAAAAAQQPNIA